MSARNTFSGKNARRFQRESRRQANEDAGLYQGTIRILRTHTSRAGVEYPASVRPSGGRASKAGRYRLSLMQGGRSSIVRLKHVPLRPALRDRLMDVGLDRLEGRKPHVPSRPAPAPAWPPWRDAERAARKSKRVAA